MATSRRQDLVARARRFSVRLLKLTAQLLRDPLLPRRLVEQLASAGTAIGNNIAEAQTATSRKQMANAYAIALREGKEARHQLEVLRDLGKGDRAEMQWLIAEADEFVAMLYVSVRQLRP